MNLAVLHKLRAAQGSAPVSRLLTSYTGASLALSLTQLGATLVDVVRVRRSSDNVEADFNPTEITDGTLTTWTGANDGFVTTWYDQAGSADATQTTSSSQPKLVSSGVVELMSGTPAINFSTTAFMSMSAITFNTAFIQAQVTSQGAINYALYNTASRGLFYNGYFAGVNGLGTFDGTTVSSISGEDLLPHLGYFNHNGTLWQVGKDGAAATNITGNTFTVNQIGRIDSPNLSINGPIQAIVLYTASQSANRAGIESFL